MKILLAAFVICSLGVMGQLKDPEDLPTADPKPKPEPKPKPGDKENGNVKSRSPTVSPTGDPGPSPPTANPTSVPTAFDYCTFYGASSGETCGTYGFNSISFCTWDIFDDFVCAQTLNKCDTSQLTACSTSIPCSPEFTCLAVCSGEYCIPKCGYGTPVYNDVMSPYGGDERRCYDATDPPPVPPYFSSSSISFVESFFSTNLGSFVFVSLVLVIVLGTFIIVRSSQLSSPQENFQELSNVETSVDRLIIRKKNKTQIQQTQQQTQYNNAAHDQL